MKVGALLFLAGMMGASGYGQATRTAAGLDRYRGTDLMAKDSLEKLFLHPPASAKPWVFWYWMQASVTKEGIRADLEAMKEEGIGGAYLMPIKGAANPPLLNPPVEQLSPAWYEMLRFAMQEADRLGLQLAMHACDGFAIAGGPWIKPELSMQKLTWSRLSVEGGQRVAVTLPQPETNEHYYKDIVVLAFPSSPQWDSSTRTVVPQVTTGRLGGTRAGADTGLAGGGRSAAGPDLQFLVKEGGKESFKSEEPCWIQYAFERPFTCRSIIIRTSGNNYQAQRLLIEVSDDGVNFRSLGRMESPRHGWQDGDADVTHTIPAVTARYFRFVYDKAGSEPGSEDLDAAKWKPTLKISGIELSARPAIYQYEGKTGEVWRVSRAMDATALPDSLCIPRDKIINLTKRLGAGGRLVWTPPPGHWTILRIGHTSTGHTNATGGAGKGLECDKFNTKAAELQFDRWFGEAIRRVGPDLAGRVLKVFHVDSWECGSQNWSPVFREEFRRRRGYDCYAYLPAMAGIPVGTADSSERFLHDVRQTIAELIHDKFYVTMARLAHAKGCSFSEESVAPTMTGDGMLHYETADIPMGEFWLNSPTHDKPNDMLDAISGAHIYGKPVIQAEGFTELKMAWDEYPGMLKTLQDRNYALGINRLVFHVFTHNPWMDRRPGMTLDGVGLYFQRDQTWWKPAKAWIDYTQRCQWLLQQGRPVADLAVFTGEEIPRRSILPDRLVSTLPGLFGKETVAREAKRLANKGEPTTSVPSGVVHSANILDAQDWIDPLHGYGYDCLNPDVLLRLAKVDKGQIVLPGGGRYSVLVLPGAHPLAPDPSMLSAEVAEKVLQLVQDGATVLINEETGGGAVADRVGADRGGHAPGLLNAPENDKRVQQVYQQLLGGVFRESGHSFLMSNVGKGRVIKGPFRAGSFDGIGLEKDLIALESDYQWSKGAAQPDTASEIVIPVLKKAIGIAYTHRTAPGLDIYFISNQLNRPRIINLSLRVSGKKPELWNAVTGEITKPEQWSQHGRRSVIPISLEANGSLFVVFRKLVVVLSEEQAENMGENASEDNILVDNTEPPVLQTLSAPWTLRFDTAVGGAAGPVIFDSLQDWSRNADSSIRYYSGTAVYMQDFVFKPVASGPSGSGGDGSDRTGVAAQRVWLDLGHVANIARVVLNGVDCGVAWTPPYRVEITSAIKPGNNVLRIDVTNTWANRLMGDHLRPESKRSTWTTAPYHLDGKLLEAGLLGPVTIRGADAGQPGDKHIGP